MIYASVPFYLKQILVVTDVFLSLHLKLYINKVLSYRKDRVNPLLGRVHFLALGKRKLAAF